jgi:hypothetical protein
MRVFRYRLVLEYRKLMTYVLLTETEIKSKVIFLLRIKIIESDASRFLENMRETEMKRRKS